MSDDSVFFGGQYDGRLLDHAYKVRHAEGGRVDVGFAFHDPLPYDVTVRARRKLAASDTSPRDDVAAFDDLFEVETDARGQSMLIPQLRHVLVQRAADPSVTVSRGGVIFRGVPSLHRATLARLCWTVVVPIQRIVVWTEVQHPYRPRPVSIDDHADEVRSILAQARTDPPTLPRPTTMDASPVGPDEDDAAGADVAPGGASADDDEVLAFLPPPDAALVLSTEAVETNQERTWFVELDAESLVVSCPDADVRQAIDLAQPFAVTLSQSRRADDACALLHLAIRQELGEGSANRVGLTSRTSGFEHPVDGLAHAGASHPMIVEDAMRTLLARLRAAMQQSGRERWR